MLLITADEDLRVRWTQWLSGIARCSWLPAVEDAPIESKSADLAIVSARSWRAVHWPPSHAAPALIGVGGSGSALGNFDAWLPDSVEQREFTQTVRLVIELSLLRRRARAAQTRESRLLEAASIDALTGVANRRAWDAEFPARLARAKEISRAMALAIFDVDQFKKANDEFGHPAGDEILRTVARSLAENTRPADLVARLGGDEFAVLFTNISQADIHEVVDRVRRRVTAQLSGLQKPVTLSAGWTIVAREENAEVATSRADRALLAAKSAGRNQTHQAGDAGDD